MKNVRLFYKKQGPLRFVSHLDMNRFMTRLLRVSGVPIWYTEGFNKHPYITFALPLSLGFYSEYEIMDFRFNDQNEDYSLELAKEKIKAVCPNGLEIIDLKEPILKSGKIGSAYFKIVFSSDSSAQVKSLEKYLNSSTIIISKKTKKGGLKEINIAEKIIDSKVYLENNFVCLDLKLPAGGEDNLNPKLVVDEYLNKICSEDKFYTVTRKLVYDVNGNQFM